MNYINAYTFPFEDESWVQKLGVATLWTLLFLFLLVIPGILYAVGYSYETARNVHKGEKTPLPDPNQLEQIFTHGVMLAIIIGGYAIPFAILTSIIEYLGLRFLAVCIGTVSWVSLGLLWHLFPVILIRNGEKMRDCFRFESVLTLAFEQIKPLLIIFVAGLIFNGLIQLIFQLTESIWVLVPIVLSAPLIAWGRLAIGHMWGQLAAVLDHSKDSAAPLPSA